MSATLDGVILANPAIADDAGLGVTGWMAVFGYLMVTVLCMRAFMVEKSGPPRPYRQALAALWRITKKHWPVPPMPARRAAIWVGIATLMLVLGINRLFDIEGFLVDTWRVEAVQEGAYDDRAAAQGMFIGAMGCMALLLAIAVLTIARGELRDFRVVMSATVFTLAFAVIRAASLHAIDDIMRVRVLGLSLSVVVELAALSLVGYAAGRRLRRARMPLFRGWTKQFPKEKGPLTVTQLDD